LIVARLYSDCVQSSSFRLFLVDATSGVGGQMWLRNRWSRVWLLLTIWCLPLLLQQLTSTARLDFTSGLPVALHPTGNTI